MRYIPVSEGIVQDADAQASGNAVASSLKARKPGIKIAVIDPADARYYQPGWTMVGGGVYEPE